MPLTTPRCITYALQSIDKTTLSYAAVFGLADETHLSGSEYPWLGAIFYLGYMFWEWPTSYLLQRYPLAKFLGVSVILWGVTLTCHAAGHNFAGLATARFFLGVFEACIQPVTMVMFSIWYTRMEQPLRLGIWIGCAGLGYVVAGITSFGIGHIHGALSSWRYTFLIWGFVTIAWGIVVLLFLPDNPVSAKFLSEDEKRGVTERVKANSTGLEEKTFKKAQMWETLSDTKTWLLFIFAISSNAPNGGLSTFQGLIIRGLGFSKLQTTLIQMPSGAIQFVVCIVATFVASSFENARLLTMFACLLPTLAGVIGMWTLPSSVPWGRLVCLWITFTYTATWTLSMSVVTANTAGHTKKSTSAAMLLIGYCLGNFIGPFFFRKAQAPRYELGVGMMLTCLGIQFLSILGLYLLFLSRNRSRAAKNALSADHIAEGEIRGLHDETDLQNQNFKYVY
ncbi:allantoate permease [Aureobasidium melanogenum CBS 110374]|uniref:Allantoate permease n=1 Tax=Aureobasidium melanogenum (strain CBS 110374) TaxID=1043003 RepID=A0A074VXV7_AURM1|nr:allantoate permease [Aureobasidium melanogenum CBS 110374]KEQ64089.1 allantoate permease [Aureobasidium melanogenum CBS 110374]